MSGWFLVPCLVVLRNEINQFAPNRDKASDGAVGDLAHQASPSDHNPDAAGRVHAIDVDSSGPWPPTWSAERLVQLLVERQRDALDDRLQNVIYQRRIWSRSWGWTVRQYTGASPHTEHIHLSARHDATREHTQPWGILEEIDMTKDEMLALLASDAAQALIGKAAGRGVHGQKLGASEVTIGQAIQTTNGAVTLLARAGDDTDETEIARQVLAGLDYRAIADAVAATLPKDQVQQLLDALSARLAA